jgi:Tfp pilus assembly protein PilN
VRPVNLIPPEDRRGEQAPLRTGPLPYILVGALVVVLIGVTAMVLIDNQIADSKSEIAKLKDEDAAAKARAERLVAYTQFKIMSEQRVATVQSLADSRFDWERVMREFSLVLPKDVWLVDLTATASPEVTINGGGGSSGFLRGQVPGPALELEGCAKGQESVAGFVTALKDIDGVTRVGVELSELGDEKEEVESVAVGANTGSSSDECRNKFYKAKFEIVVAFDAAPVSSEATEAEAVPSPTEKAETASTESSESATASAEGG